MSRKSDAAKREMRRKAIAVNLRAGLTYREMAGKLSVSIGTISNDVKIIFGRWHREHAMEAAALMEMRFDHALNAIWNSVLDGDIAAINTMLKIEAQRAQLGGLNAPTKTEHTGAGGSDLLPVNDIVAALLSIRKDDDSIPNRNDYAKSDEPDEATDRIP